MPAALEYHLVDIFEEGRRLRGGIGVEPVLASAVQAGLGHARVLVVLLTVGLLSDIGKD